MGVFATRTPHRYNPIGLSICKVEEVHEQSLVISGIDLVDQTPIVGMYPYTKNHAVKSADLIIPDWLEQTKTSTVAVTWSERATRMLADECGDQDGQNPSQQDKAEQLTRTIERILELNPHTVSTIKKQADEIIYAIQIGNLQVIYQYNGVARSIHVECVLNRDKHADLEVFQYKIRSSQWYTAAVGLLATLE
mmetsp:Transcript_41696/g.48140  ORF Transcript_41696/g.48140 Transcript_41696/m.48140 type:complete len:193 (-) Transcript_41696:35-613(-)